MAFRGRGRGRGGRGRFGGGFMERRAKDELFILLPEDVTLPSLPNIDTSSNEEKLLIRSKYKLEIFWVGSCYHLEEEAFPKSEGRKAKKRKLADLGAKRSKRVTKKLRWDRDSSDKKFDMFAKLEEKLKGKDEEAEKDVNEEEEEGESESDDGDYAQNVEFDDDDDDMNMDEEPEEEDFYE